MKVWIVQGDDRDYDWGDQWVVGLYSSEEKAKAAAEKDEAEYRTHHFGHIQLEYNISEMEVQ